MNNNKSKENLLADRLRRCYQFERNCYARYLNRPDDYRVPSYWDTDSSESREPSVWHKLARFCRQRKIEPFRYTYWSLSPSQLLLDPPPEPNQLLRPKRMDFYVDTRHKRREKAAYQLRSDLTGVEREYTYLRSPRISSDQAWAATLLASHLQVSPLYRYGVARTLKSERFLSIASFFKPNAMIQYQHNAVHYEACWPRPFMPPGFAEEAAEYYLHLLDQEP